MRDFSVNELPCNPNEPLQDSRLRLELRGFRVNTPLTRAARLWNALPARTIETPTQRRVDASLTPPKKRYNPKYPTNQTF